LGNLYEYFVKNKTLGVIVRLSLGPADYEIVTSASSLLAMTAPKNGLDRLLVVETGD
jgi:hypothetical protein